MLLGWLMVALGLVLVAIGSVYDARRKRWIKQLEPGTLYRPVNGVGFAISMAAVISWDYGAHLMGGTSRWLFLAVLLCAIVLVARRIRRRRLARR